jgi:hypothetical protein
LAISPFFSTALLLIWQEIGIVFTNRSDLVLVKKAPVPARMHFGISFSFVLLSTNHMRAERPN